MGLRLLEGFKRKRNIMTYEGNAKSRRALLFVL